MKLSLSATIAAISTGQAQGGIGVVRISGPDAFAVADRVFSAVDGSSLADSPGYRAHFGSVSVPSEGWSDEAVALVFRAPHSYTGEDVVELSCHGGLYTTRMTLRACLEAGAVSASRGEFTRRAYENGRISLTQAESVMSVISAQGRQAAIAAHSAADGRLARTVAECRDQLRSIAARIAAWCDFPEEDDVPEVSTAGIVADIAAVRDRLARLVRSGDACAAANGVDTVICGKPNVGKSTLMNLLSGCERSIVTDIPGTTRDVVEQQVTLGDCILRLSDTAGMHSTEDIIETIGVERTRERIERAALVIAVFDGASPLDDDDTELIESVRGRSCVAVINKSDLPEKIDRTLLERSFGRCVSLSAASGDGVEQLAKAVAEVTGLEQMDAADGVLVSERQLECARRALENVTRAAEEAESVTLDAVGLLIFDAVDALEELEGGNASEEILAEVFSKFCIGK